MIPAPVERGQKRKRTRGVAPGPQIGHWLVRSATIIPTWTPKVKRPVVLSLQRPANLPMMAEGIHDAPEAPAVVLFHGHHHARTGSDRLGEHPIGIRHGEHHPHGATTHR